MVTYEQLLDRDFDWALREGSMHFEGASAVHKTLKRLSQRLDELDVDYAIAGGMALFFHGYRRFTEDVDVLVTPEGLEAIHANLEGRGYVKPFENSRNLRDAETGVKIDFLVSGQYPGDGKPGPIEFPVPGNSSVEIDGCQFLNIEEIIQLKLASGQESHRVGDLDDVQKLIQTLGLTEDFSERLDPTVRESYLLKWKDAQKANQDEH